MVSRATETTPIENILIGDRRLGGKYVQEYIELFAQQSVGSVQVCKAALGPQRYTWTGEFRFWVWTGANWRIHASNHKGLCFEVLPSLTPQQAYDAWREVCPRLKEGKR